ncbi:MAG TPA: orotidine-5'-phosphate decarboxylase [Actinomycetota bacterium]|nr:orotidine-5'-phosphate decarboxylase [Actinomycetota bacterium]
MSTLSATGSICVALDSPDPSDVVAMADRLEGSVGMVKVGLTAFTAGGPWLVERLAAHKLFLDLKLHDIPDQVGGAVAAVDRLGVALTTVHAGGGRRMLAAAAEAAGPDLKVIAVTVLTSLDDADLSELGVRGGTGEAVLRLADIALEAGVGGLVCSPLEIAAVRERFGSYDDGGPYLVVPGIRPAGSQTHDQRRTLTPAEALDAGADLLVVGRPITGADDPVAAARAIGERG